MLPFLFLIVKDIYLRIVLCLQGIQLRILSVSPHQLVMRSVFGKPASIQHRHSIAESRRRHPMGNIHRRPASDQLIEAAVKFILRPGVHRRRRFVQHYDRGILAQRSRQCNLLRLAAGRLEALLIKGSPHKRIQPVGQRFHPGLHAHLLKRIQKLLVIDIPPQRKVVPQ